MGGSRGFFGIIVAGGSGSRAGEGLAKQWRALGGRHVMRWSVQAMLAAGATRVVVVIPAGDEGLANKALDGLGNFAVVAGGATRAGSVRAGLEALTGEAEDAPVLVHDAARPLVKLAHIDGILTALTGYDGALPALPVADTLKRGEAGAVAATVSREGLWRAQTPQAFRLGPLRGAYAAWPADAGEPTDDAAVMEAAGGKIALAPGDPLLMKLTYPEDFAMAERLAGPIAAVTRIGQGFDAHRFGEGDHLWLCGVRIPHDRTLIGHSDADAGLHALTDALLGAIGAGDIGDHFPPSDPRWRGAASSVFLEHAARLVTERGGRIANVDVTLICERPKVKPHREAMRARVAELLGLALDQVSVKATTTEAMGFTGREEGLAAQAVAAVEMGA